MAKNDETFRNRLEHAWNAFRGVEAQPRIPLGGEISYGLRPDRTTRHSSLSSKGIVTPIITQIAIDAAGVELRHTKVGEDGEYLEDMRSYFNECLMTDPNLDQGPTAFRQDIYTTMLTEGVVAIVPVETDLNPEFTGGYDIQQLRVGTITQWLPQQVRVDLYDQTLGVRREILLDKKYVAIVENPLYEIMNAPNSTLQRLIYKLGQLDVTDNRIASGKLDIILQLPYTIKHETRRVEAKRRLTDLEGQLSGSAYGIGYIDGTERITQLNRPSENQLLAQVKDLEDRVHAQIGLTPEIFFGTAEEAAMINYHNRTVYPVVRAVQEEMRRKFLSKTARSRSQSVQFFRNPFAMVPVSQIAEIADKFLRNEIMSPNEFRPIVGLRPVDDPDANELRNRNMPKVDTGAQEEPKVDPAEPDPGKQPPKDQPQEGKSDK